MPIEGQDPVLAKLADDLTREEYGIGLIEATKQGICVQCKEPALPKCYSAAGRREYAISGMCEQCFDAMFADDEGDD